ncbi:MAG: type I-D CRISPR-associated protein Cas7/Csc2 [Candidatus Methanogaster sp.]|uniref:Type I-D CRISPR-associated protein Cas7/Csc2 n=1 Tax=Candidatus Methanogaster sp. TaxID=3386292 RepID=A0AC61KZN8_9EURY|nr:MAG: type I-D CRISPR-associated protein Cas7/Csc2 [ANME-2 cluster archaeon]
MISEEQLKDITQKLEKGLVEELTNNPGNRFVNILVLRELQSNAVFTTNGQDADVVTLTLNNGDESMDYSPAIMFMRKQTGSDRRFGKAMLRTLLDVECTMQVNKMCQKCLECVLYGSAASEDVKETKSVTSRVMYDTAFTIRDSSAIIEEKFQNAPGDGYAKESTTAIREPDFFNPGVMFPCVITLRDATFAELLFILSITLKNKRYGAVTTRIGRVKNHILGIYAGSEEGPSNLELTTGVIWKLAEETGKSLEDVVTSSTLDAGSVLRHTKNVFDDLVEKERLEITGLEESDLNAILASLTDEMMKDVFGKQNEMSGEFINSIK